MEADSQYIHIQGTKNFKIHCLQFLQIVKVELNNLLCEVITCRLLKNAENYDFITDHQYGGKQGREAIDIPALTAWQIKIFTLVRHNAAFTDCDAKACYDQGIPTAAVLAQIQASLPIHTAQFFLCALTQLEYHMVTSYGVLDTGVTHSPLQPIYDLG
eukprot:13280144-Ditylum_brightwellii.AAC.1